MKNLKKRIYKLKKIELLLKRITYSVFHKTHPIFKKKDYLLNLFKEKALEYNIQALNFKEGIVLGEFQDKNYLIHCQHGNLLESTIYIEKIWEGYGDKHGKGVSGDAKNYVYEIYLENDNDLNYFIDLLKQTFKK